MSELTWRAFCEMCAWRVERCDNRDSALARAKEHALKHDDEWAVRIQGLALTREWSLLDGNANDEMVMRYAKDILTLAHGLDALPYDQSADLDTPLWIALAACRDSLVSLCERFHVNTSTLEGAGASTVSESAVSE